MNHNDVTSTPRDDAAFFVEQAEEMAELIGKLHSDALIPNRGALLNKANLRLGIALKLAEVSATLAVADAIDACRRATSEAVTPQWAFTVSECQLSHAGLPCAGDTCEHPERES